MAGRPKSTAVQPSSNSSAKLVIGIGASAGGLEALTGLISQLPDQLPAVILIAQHLSPTHRSMMAELLSKATSLPVTAAVDGIPLDAGHIYVGPPGLDLTVVDQLIRLTKHSEPGRPHPSVDRLFESLAVCYGEAAVGVILSGTGKDGAIGVRRIKEAQGKILVQTAETARYSGMPEAALQTGSADFSGSPAQLADALLGFFTLEPTISKPSKTPALDQLFDKLRQRTGNDFSEYKEASVMRRLERRIQATHTTSLDDYLHFIEHSPVELDRLHKELLISVTSFFRDPNALTTLDHHLAKLIAEKPADEDIRVWVAGCATGEEAYTMAMLVNEHLMNQQRSNKVKIFASDIDNTALALARKACYPSSAVAALEPEFIKRYFRPDHGGWCLKSPLRDMVTIAYHDMNRDPPFVRIDLVSCRNVLIYFNIDLQHRVLRRFHSALRDNGLLFLGRSENVTDQDALFAEIDRPARIFRAKLVARHYRPASDNTHSLKLEPVIPEVVNQIAREQLAPGVLLSNQLDIEYTHGDVSRFLRLESGKASFNVLHLLDQRYRGEAHSLLRRTKQERLPVKGREWTLTGESDATTLRLVTYPFTGRQSDWIYLGFEETAFREAPTDEQNIDPQNLQHRALEDELMRMREHQQIVVEELETSNEELQSLNEEMHATNEELETSNEELQATNEELTTVNEELENKSQELYEANLDLENLHQSIRYVVVVFDRRLEVHRANDAALRLFPVLAKKDTSLEIFSHMIGVADLQTQTANVLSGAAVSEQQVHSGGHWYSLRLYPINAAVENISGVMLTLIDQTDLIVTSRRLEKREKQFTSLMDHATTLFSIKDAQGRYHYANPAFLDLFSVSVEQLLGKTATEVLAPETATIFQTRDIECLAREQLIESEDNVKIATGQRTLLSVRFLLDDDDAVQKLCTQAIDITDLRRSELHATRQFQLQQAVLNSLPANIAVLDAHGTVISVNDSWKRFSAENGDPDQLRTGVGRNYLSVCDNASGCFVAASSDASRVIRQALAGEQPVDFVKYPCHSRDEARWFLMSASPLRYTEGGAVISHLDITAWQLSEQRRRLATAVVENSKEGVSVLDSAGRILMVNKALTDVTGLRASKLIGQRWRCLRFVKLVDGSTRDLTNRLRKTGTWEGEALIRKGRQTNPIWLTVNRLRDETDSDSIHYVLLLSDISKLRKAEASLLELAYQDTLTGLSNRTSLLERMEHALAQALRRQQVLAVLFLDLDRFKLINDSLGHEVGDEILRMAAQRIRETVRRSDLVARLGGDEFVVVLEELRHAEDAAITAEKINAALGYPFNVAGHEIYLSGSIGITLYPEDADNVNGLLKNADTAMYQAKELGRGRHQFFRAELYQRSQRRLWLEGELRRALERDELVLHYQPQYHTRSGKPRGVECLIRWQHASEGLILPDEFVPLAEETGFIERIGTWVLQQACAEFRNLRQQGATVDVISVNVSAHQLREVGFAAKVSESLARADLPPACLELELTESALVQNQEIATQVLQELREFGVRVALDDFGTGYSSLSYLHRYPISTLKIDRSFVRDMPTDSNDAAIVKAILAMAKVLNLDVVAEGVEHREQLNHLQDWGCDFVQGYLASRALPADELPALFSIGSPSVFHQ